MKEEGGTEVHPLSFSLHPFPSVRPDPSRPEACWSGMQARTVANSASLFPQAQAVDDLLVAGAVFPRQVLQQTVSLADHLEQPATRGVVLLVRLEVLGQLGDPRGQQRDLDLGRTRVLRMYLVVSNDLRLL